MLQPAPPRCCPSYDDARGVPRLRSHVVVDIAVASGRFNVTLAICFAFGAVVGWLAHKAEAEQEKRKSAALSKVFEREKR